MTDEQLTATYNEANGISGGKNPPITTQHIFAAMRLVAVKEREKFSNIVWSMYKEGPEAMDEAIRSMK